MSVGPTSHGDAGTPGASAPPLRVTLLASKRTCPSRWIHHAAERHPRRSSKSRSRLYADAIAEHLAEHSAEEVTEAMDGVVDRSWRGGNRRIRGARSAADA